MAQCHNVLNCIFLEIEKYKYNFFVSSVLSWRTFKQRWQSSIRAVNSMFLDQYFMFDCYKYIDISGSGLDANVY
jgi:hypothetical protein